MQSLMLFGNAAPFAFTTGPDRSGVAVRFADALILPKPFRFSEVEAAIGKFRESCQN